MNKNSVNILLIDDDAAYVSIAQHLLKKFPGKDFNLTWKNTGESALQELKNNLDIDIVLLDYYLPEKNGLEIVKEISENNISVPIIFLTSNKNFKIAIEAMKYNVEDYLIKNEAGDTALPRAILTVLEKIKIRKQLEKIEKEKILTKKKIEAINELVVTICHEFNNPLAAIKISVEIINRQNLLPEAKELIEELITNLNLIEKEIATIRDLNTTELIK